MDMWMAIRSFKACLRLHKKFLTCRMAEYFQNWNPRVYALDLQLFLISKDGRKSDRWKFYIVRKPHHPHFTPIPTPSEYAFVLTNNNCNLSCNQIPKTKTWYEVQVLLCFSIFILQITRFLLIKWWNFAWNKIQKYLLNVSGIPVTLRNRLILPHNFNMMSS